MTPQARLIKSDMLTGERTEPVYFERLREAYEASNAMMPNELEGVIHIFEAISKNGEWARIDSCIRAR